MTLGLVMIVRNEANVIERCLTSVRDKIDHWTIVDTGSIDGTQTIVELALHGIAGELHQRPWVDFGHNRTEALELARGHTDWLIALDADMTLDVVGPYPDGAAGLIRYTGGLDYAQALLLNGRIPWRYVGKTHEYVMTDQAGARTVPAPGWAITHHTDGSSRSEKYSRDLELLVPDAEAGDPRAMFYVARTYVEIMGNPEIVFADVAREDLKGKAMEWFRRRVDAGEAGFPEEQFFAQYQLGFLAWDMVELARAAQMRPSRAEPYLFMAQIASERGDYDQALALAEQGLAIPYPTGDLLFVERWIYEWGLRLERSAAAWWCGQTELCAADSRALLAQPPEWIRDRIRTNLELCR